MRDDGQLQLIPTRKPIFLGFTNDHIYITVFLEDNRI